MDDVKMEIKLIRMTMMSEVELLKERIEKITTLSENGHTELKPQEVKVLRRRLQDLSDLNQKFHNILYKRGL